MTPYFFYIFSSISVLMVIMMIFQKNPISSAMCLIVSFFGLAGIYVMLDAHFVAILQILVYAGAIMVLFIFVIMLLNLKNEDLKVSRTTFAQVMALVSSCGLLAFLVIEYLKLPPVSFPEASAGFGTAQFLGTVLFSRYVVAFEVMGLLLLVGIVGAVLLGRKEDS